MSVIDMNAIFNAWCRKRNIYGVSTPNFSNVSLKAKPLLLSKFKYNRDLKKKVTFHNANCNAGSDALVQIRASLNENNTERLIIQRGVITGLPNAHINIRKEDWSLELDLSVDLQSLSIEPFMNQPFPVASETYMRHTHASAEVSYKESKLTERFQCEIIISGFVTFSQNGLPVQVEICSMIQALHGIECVQNLSYCAQQERQEGKETKEGNEKRCLAAKHENRKRVVLIRRASSKRYMEN